MLVLADMELEGVYVDLTKLNEIRSLFSDELMTLTQAIYKQSGQHFILIQLSNWQRFYLMSYNYLLLKKLRRRIDGYVCFRVFNG